MCLECVRHAGQNVAGRKVKGVKSTMPEKFENRNIDVDVTIREHAHETWTWEWKVKVKVQK